MKLGLMLLLLLVGCATDNAPATLNEHVDGRAGFYTTVGGGAHF